MKAWAALGKVLGRILQPALRIYFRGSRRARLIVVHDNSVLLVKDWLGSQAWSLPGGGIHANESIEAAARRELREETRIVLDDSFIEIVGEAQIDQDAKQLSYQAYFCIARVDKRHAPRINRFELLDAQWFDCGQLPSSIDSAARCGLKRAQLIRS